MTKNSPIALSRIQRLIGQRMLDSEQSKPCIHLQCGIDITELMYLRPGLKKSLGVKITTNAFYIKAVALAAAEFPLVLGTITGEGIRIASSVNVSFAVSAPRGLLVPVVRAADRRPLDEIARLEKALTERARANTLALTDMQGETIAVSNLGAYAVDSFIGIVPPPASAIATFGNVLETVVPAAGGAAVRRILSLGVSCDNRLVNAFYAAAFVNHIRSLLQNPAMLAPPAGSPVKQGRQTNLK